MVVVLDDYRREDPEFRMRMARRHLRKAALKPGELPPTQIAQKNARLRALAALIGAPDPVQD